MGVCVGSAGFVAGGAVGDVRCVPGGAVGLLVCGCVPGGKAGFCSWPGGLVASLGVGTGRGVCDGVWATAAVVMKSAMLNKTTLIDRRENLILNIRTRAP